MGEEMKNMWLLFAFDSAFFAGLTAILAKCGIKNIDSNVATAVRTVVVLLFSWVMVFIVGSQTGLPEISARTLVFLVLSGLATGASWLCYFHALQIGDINKVTPVDKCSVVLTMLLAFLFLGEGISALKVVCMILIGAGTLLMIEKKRLRRAGGRTNGADDREGAGEESFTRTEVGKFCLASLCLWQCLFCQPDFNSWKSRYRRSGIQSGDGNPNHCRVNHGVDDGGCHREIVRGESHRPEKLDFSYIVRFCHRRLLALLLSCASDRTGQRGSSGG